MRRFSLAVGLAAVFAGGLLVLGGFLIVHHTGLFSRNAHAATPATQNVRPGVSAAVYRAAVQRACDRRRLAVSALAHRLHRHPEAIGPTTRRLLRIENRFQSDLLAVGDVDVAIGLRPGADDDLKAAFLDYLASLQTVLAHAGNRRVLRAQAARVRAAEAAFNRFAGELALDCHLP